MLKYIQKIRAVFPKSFFPRTLFSWSKRELDEAQKQKYKEYAFRAVVAAMMLVALGSSYTAVTGRSITVSNNSSGRDLPIYCVQTDKNQIALSFDAAWGNEDTQDILDILNNHDIRVTFFMTGGWVEEYPDDVKAILAAGHDLANHGENHKHMSRLSNDQIKDEIMKVHERVKELTGYEMDLFRPPYGDYDNDVIKTARKIGYYTVQWDVDSLDWKDYGVDSIIKTVCEHKNLGNGSIILMHNGAKHTHKALDAMITRLKEAGYEFVPISELIYRDKYSMNHEGRQIPKS